MTARRRPRPAISALALALAVVVACVVGFVVLRGHDDTPGRAAAANSTTTTSSAAVGPLLLDPNDPTKNEPHWHAALGVYDCDHWMGDRPGSGVWNWPTATPEDGPGRAADPNVYAGLHSHDDGVIHMEPLSPDDTGNNATLGLYFEYGGWKLSATGFDFLGTAVTNGDTCVGKTGTLQWAIGSWNGDTTGKVKPKYTVHTGNPADYKLLNHDVIVVAFLPSGTSIASIGDPPSLLILAGEMSPPPTGARGDG